MGSNFQKLNEDRICNCINLNAVLDIMPEFFRTVELSPLGKSVIYSRMPNGTSMLGIQLCDGPANLKENYMLWSCSTDTQDQLKCDVHIQPVTHKNVAVPACKITPEQITAIREFFETTEQELLSNGLFGQDLTVHISLDYLVIGNQDEEDERKVRFGQRIRTIFRKKGNKQDLG